MKKFLKWGLVSVIALIAVGVVFLSLQLHQDTNASFEYRLKWLANAGFVGDLYADTYGYYQGEGLHVQVAQGGPNRDALAALLRPKSSTLFAVASADQVIQAVYRDSKRGSDLKVIAQIYAANPVQWIYRTATGRITSPSQLRGKRIGIAIGDNDQTIMKAFLKKNGIAESDVTFVGIQFDYGPFISGAVDLFPVYTNTQGVELRRQLEAAHEQVGFFDPSLGPNGIRFVANSIVTTSRTIADHPDLVERFLRATIRGWNDSILPENRERAVHAVALAAGETSDTDIITDQVAETAALIQLKTPGYRIGTIDMNAWRETEATMFAEGLLKDVQGNQPKKMIGIDAYLSSQFLPH